MNKQLYEQAKKTVEKEREKEIKEVYESLVYESELVEADAKTFAKIKKLNEIAQRLGARSMGDGYLLHGLKNSIEEMAKTGKYHPTTLKKCEREVLRRVERRRLCS